MNSSDMFSMFLRDAPVTAFAYLSAADVADRVDAMTMRKSRNDNGNDVFTLAVRFDGDWKMRKFTCNPPDDEWDAEPKMRSLIDEMVDGMVTEIGAIA